MIKKYNHFINEKLSDYLTGPSEKEVRKNLGGINIFNKNKQMIQYAKAGMWDMVKKALKRGADIHYNDNLLLFYICEYDNVEMFEYINNNYILLFNNYENALNLSLLNGSFNIIDYLLNLNKLDPNRLKLILKARFNSSILKGRIDIAKYILTKDNNIYFSNFGLDIKKYELPYSFKEVYKIISENHLNSLEFLHELNSTTLDANQVLTISAGLGKLDIVKFAIKIGANKNILKTEKMQKILNDKNYYDIIEYIKTI